MDNTFIDCLKLSLKDMKEEIDLAFAPLSPKDGPTTESEIDMLVNVLTDPHTFHINKEDIRALIASLVTLRESGVHLSRLPLDRAQGLTVSLETATIKTTTTLSAGLALSHLSSHVSVQSTSLFLPRWMNPYPECETFYYPLIARSSSSAGAIHALASQIYGGPLDQRKACFEIWKKVETCLLHVWCLVFDHWIGAKTPEPTDTDKIGSPTMKTETNDVKPSNEEVVKTEFDDIILLPRAPKRQFKGVMIHNHKRKRDPSINSNELEASQSLAKKVKREVKKEEPDDLVIKKEENAMLHEPIIPGLSRLYEFPDTWPESIKRRLRRIPSLPSVPDHPFMYRKFEKLEFSKTYGGPSVAFEDTWNRTEKADEHMPGLGHPRMMSASQDYNFFLPLVPCAPGLVFRGPRFSDNLDVDPNDLFRQMNPEPRTVFVRIRPKAWLYVGEYRIRLSAPLEEWWDLTDKQRQLWKGHINKLPAITKRNKMRSEEMHEALDNGTRMLEVFTMECVGYHEGIQRAICLLPSAI